MEQPSRRAFLKTGGAAVAGVGALGTLNGCAPGTGTVAPWTWSPEGSLPGTGTGADPRWVWDPDADDLVRSLLDRGIVPDVNDQLRGWRRNGQALPAELPSDVKDFIEHARQLPSWTDQDQLHDAVVFNQRRGLYLGVTYGFASGMMSTVIPREARAVYYSKGGANLQDRITKTAKLGYDVGSRNAFAPDGEMIVTCVKTRLAHAGVRNLLPQSPHWTAVADEEIPISQRDIMITWASLPTTVMENLAKWKVPITFREGQGFLHSWQLTAHLLGVRDEYIPGSWATAKSQADELLTPILAPTPEGIELAHQLLNLGAALDSGLITRPLLGALTRFVLGDQIANWLAIPTDNYWDGVFDSTWAPFVAAREQLLSLEPSPGIITNVYETFDEILRQGALWYLSTGRYPISIEIPTANNPNL